MEKFNLAAIGAGSKSGCPVLGHHKRAGKYNFDFSLALPPSLPQTYSSSSETYRISRRKLNVL